MRLDETRRNRESARAAGPATSGRRGNPARLSAAPEDLSSPGLSEVSAGGGPSRLGVDGQLPGRANPAVQHLRRPEASGREVAGELPGAASQTGGHLRAESRIVAG